MCGHERFEELCALAASGQIGAADWELLKAHIASCECCAELLGAMGKVGGDLIAEFDREIPTGHFTEMRSRFVDRVRQVGGNVGNPVVIVGRTSWFRPALWVAGTTAAVVLVFAGIYHQGRTAVRTAPNQTATSTVVETSIQRPAEGPTVATRTETTDFSSLLRSLQGERDALERKLNVSAARQQELEARLEQMSGQVVRAKEEAAAAESERKLSAEQLAQVREVLEKSQLKTTSQEGQLLAARVQIEDLGEQLLHTRAGYEQENALLAAGKEGQSILGSRNLHIVDVYDSDGRGKRGSFGRVFYVEGRELVFYAFDLGDPRHANAQFYAWGKGEGPGEAVTRLGILHNDGRNEQRWVMKYTDAKVLSKLDSIFVTAETSADPEKPKGRRLLFAVMTGQANHS